MAVYGGLAGSEIQPSERSWPANVTILSGDIGTIGSTGDNSYHVVTSAANATLDGFTITGGNANGSDPDSKGGGIYNASVNLTLSNLVISGNTAMSMGGDFTTMATDHLWQMLQLVATPYLRVAAA